MRRARLRDRDFLRHAASTSVEVTIQLRDAGDRGDRQ
jgi:hypothetical protein